MLDSLGRSEEAGIQGKRTFVLLHDFGALLGDTDDGSTSLALGLFIDDCENLVQALDLTLCLIAVLFEGCL